MAYSSKQIRSAIGADGTLKLSLVTEEVTDPGPDEVIVRIEAAPINPSDLGLLFGPADIATARRPRPLAGGKPRTTHGDPGRVRQRLGQDHQRRQDRQEPP